MNKYITYPIAFCLYIASAVAPLNAEERNKPLSPTRFHTITNERTLESLVVLPPSPRFSRYGIILGDHKLPTNKSMPIDQRFSATNHKLQTRNHKPQTDNDSWSCGTSAWKRQKPQKEYWHCVFEQ